MLIERKPAKHTSVRKRTLSLTSHEQVFIRDLYSEISILIDAVNVPNIAEELRVHLIQYIRELLRTLVSIIYVEVLPILPIKRIGNIAINNYTDDCCFCYFGFRQQDLLKLLRLVQPENVNMVLDNGIPMKFEELLLRGLYELKTGNTKLEIGLSMFGGDGSLQSRAFTKFIDYFYDNYHELLHNNVNWFFENNLIQESCAAINVSYIFNFIY